MKKDMVSAIRMFKVSEEKHDELIVETKRY